MSGDRLANNFWHMLLPIDQGMGIAWVVLELGIVAYVYARRQKAPLVVESSLLFVTVCTVGNWWLSAGISNVNYDSAGRMRHIFPTVVMFIALWAALLLQIGWAARHWLKAKEIKIKWLPIGVTAIVLLVILPGYITNDVRRIADFQRGHAMTHTLAWFDNTPPQDGIVLSPARSSTNTLWNRFWGMYVGSKEYNVWFEPLDTIIKTPPSAYLARNILWFVLDENDRAAIRDAVVLNDYLGMLLHVKTITANPAETQGKPVDIYRFALPQVAADYIFGDAIKLVGYDLSASTLKIGDSLTFRPYWKLVQPRTQNLSLFFHLYAAQSVEAGKPELLAQFDTTPLHNTDSPTSQWHDTDEVYFSNPFVFIMPADAPAGDYVLGLGLYDYLTGVRQPGQDGQTYYRINITVL